MSEEPYSFKGNQDRNRTLKTVPFLIAARKKNAGSTKDNNEILAGLNAAVA